MSGVDCVEMSRVVLPPLELRVDSYESGSFVSNDNDGNKDAAEDLCEAGDSCRRQVFSQLVKKEILPPGEGGCRAQVSRYPCRQCFYSDNNLLLSRKRKSSIVVGAPDRKMGWKQTKPWAS